MADANSPSAAEAQHSEFGGVSTADLVVLFRALMNTPATLATSAVLGRVRYELDQRPSEERDPAFEHEDNKLPLAGRAVAKGPDFARRDKVRIGLPGSSVTMWCLVEYVMTDGDLAIVQINNGKRHVARPGQVVEHVVADLRA